MSAYDDALNLAEMLRQAAVGDAAATYNAGGISGQASRQAAFNTATRAAEVAFVRRKIVADVTYNAGANSAGLLHHLRNLGAS